MDYAFSLETLQVAGLLHVYAFMVLSCLILFASTRERLYLMQGLFCLALMSNTMVTAKFLELLFPAWLAPDSGTGYSPAMPWLVAGSGSSIIIAGILLFRDFTLAKVYFPRTDRFLKLTALAILPVTLMLLVLDPGLAVTTVNMAGLVLVPLIIGLSVRAGQKGHREAIYQLLTFSVFLAVTMFYTIGPFLEPAVTTISRLVFYYGAAASLVLLSLGVARRMNTLKSERERIKDLFGTYVSSQVVNQILHKQLTWEGEERIATVLFTDIRNYTALAERLQPRDVIRLLNEYYAVLVDIVNRHNGIVNKFMGDSIMALFNVPLDQADHACQAIEAGREILEQTASRTFGAAPGDSPAGSTGGVLAGSSAWQPGLVLRTNVGIHTGRVVVGNVGSSTRLEYSVMGDTVNMASRLEQLNKEFDTPLLLSGETARLYGRDTALRLVKADLVVRGRTSPCSVYTLVD